MKKEEQKKKMMNPALLQTEIVGGQKGLRS